MKAFLYKSKLLITIYIAAAMLLTLASAAIINQYFKDEKILKCLSDNYCIGVINSYDIFETRSVKNSDISTYLDSIDKEYIFIRYLSSTQGKAVVYSDEANFSIPLVSGRLFEQADFNNHTNTVIVSNELINECIDRENQLYYLYNNKLYEVIGSYQGTVGSSMEETLFYINMRAEYLYDDIAYGQYILDVNTNSYSACDKLEAFLSELNGDLVLKHVDGLSAEGVSFSDIISNAAKMISIILISVLLIMMNSISVSHQWVHARKKEIAIRKLLGASNEKIKWWIIRQYFLLISFSFFIGTVIATFVIVFSDQIKAIPTIFLLFGSHVKLSMVILAFLILLFEGALVLGLTLKHFSKTNIVTNVR